jgi:hypothetical protein
MPYWISLSAIVKRTRLLARLRFEPKLLRLCRSIAPFRVRRRRPILPASMTPDRRAGRRERAGR